MPRPRWGRAAAGPGSRGALTPPPSRQQFHEAAYLADDRHDLLTAINEFLDCSVVLPPSEVQGEELLRSVAHFQREMLKKREEQERRLLLEPKSPEEKGTARGAGSGWGVPAGGVSPSLRPSVCPWGAALLKLKVVEGEGEEEDDPLRRTGRPFGGLIRDVRRRYPKYLSDFRDALNPQCIAAVIFIYFAALSPAITFGGLLGECRGGTALPGGGSGVGRGHMCCPVHAQRVLPGPSAVPPGDEGPRPAGCA